MHGICPSVCRHYVVVEDVIAFFFVHISCKVCTTIFKEPRRIGTGEKSYFRTIYASCFS